MAITGTQSTSQILAQNAAANRLRAQQAQLVEPETASINASNPIGLISQGLSTATNALTAGDRRAASQANLERENALLQEQRNQANTPFNQGQVDRQAQIAGERALVDLQSQELDLQGKTAQAKNDLLKRDEFKNLPPGTVQRASDINQYYAEGAASGGQQNAISRALALPQFKGFTGDQGAVENFTESVVESMDNIRNDPNYSDISPALLDFAVYTALQETEFSEGTIFNWFKGDANSGDLTKLLKKNLKGLERADALAFEQNKIDNQARNESARLQIEAARKGLR